MADPPLPTPPATMVAFTPLLSRSWDDFEPAPHQQRIVDVPDLPPHSRRERPPSLHYDEPVPLRPPHPRGRSPHGQQRPITRDYEGGAYDPGNRYQHDFEEEAAIELRPLRAERTPRSAHRPRQALREASGMLRPRVTSAAAPPPAYSDYSRGSHTAWASDGPPSESESATSDEDGSSDDESSFSNDTGGSSNAEGSSSTGSWSDTENEYDDVAPSRRRASKEVHFGGVESMQDMRQTSALLPEEQHVADGQELTDDVYEREEAATEEVPDAWANDDTDESEPEVEEAAAEVAETAIVDQEEAGIVASADAV